MRALSGEANRRLTGQTIFGEKIKAFEFFDGRSLMRLFLENAGDKCLKMRGSMYCFREREGTFFDLLVCIFDIFRLERRSTIDQSVNNDSYTPHIYFITMPLRL